MRGWSAVAGRGAAGGLRRAPVTPVHATPTATAMILLEPFNRIILDTLTHTCVTCITCTASRTQLLPHRIEERRHLPNKSMFLYHRCSARC